MKTKKTDELDDFYNQIEETENEKAKKALQTGGSPDFLKLVKGQKVRVVLLPYMKNPKNTFITYEKIGFFKEAEKEYIDLGRSPKSEGVKGDPVAALQWKVFSEAKERGDEIGKKSSYKLLPQRESLVNVLVLEDSNNADNKGTVKILKYGARMNKTGELLSVIAAKIWDGVFGERKEKIGQKAFLTKKSGVFRPLIISVKDKGGFNNYDDTVFDDTEEHEYTLEDVLAIYEQCYDLEQYRPELKTNSELKELLDLHWHQTDITKQDDDLDLEDEEEEEEEVAPKAPTKKAKVPTKVATKPVEKDPVEKDPVDDMIDEFETDDLDDLDID